MEPTPAEPARFEPAARHEVPAAESPAPALNPAMIPATSQRAAEPAPSPAPPRRAAGLFSRAATKALDLARQTGADLREATPSAMMGRMAKPEPVMRAPAPAPMPTPQPPAPQPAVQTRLALDPTDRIAAPRPSEEEMLDIPAFLRRQAN
jgi:cell division protein FtsZ